MDLANEFSTTEYYPKTDTGFKRISQQKCILVFVWYATHEAAAFQDVADRFDISIGCLHTIIEKVGLFLSSKSRSIITWPNEIEMTNICEEFNDMGFPDVAGCMDGCHIKIGKPQIDPESYINRKKYYSVQFQAVCDSRRFIRDVFIGYPGSVHDARVFKNSSLYNTLPQKCGEKYIIADSAYPCLRHVLTPYKNTGNLTEIGINFNYKLSHCRILIEHTFGLLKQRFRQLYHLKLRNMETICHFIRACCVLHNLILLQGLTEIEEDNNDSFNEENLPKNAEIQNDNVAGLNCRNYIAAVLFNR
ncbi:hypothetical protein NQ315_014709 [Exocentrus adspersus]|uniref:DDE Tnp4 domain-containing protein n=1 Tax=Exocentrus adspersus TaxID=1586481 RepID=A0AAV8VE74_9CUCU|nr:hypothetical protein NQ315_014709 [Exocentrus adspersus]